MGSCPALCQLGGSLESCRNTDRAEPSVALLMAVVITQKGLYRGGDSRARCQ